MPDPTTSDGDWLPSTDSQSLDDLCKTSWRSELIYSTRHPGMFLLKSRWHMAEFPAPLTCISNMTITTDTFTKFMFLVFSTLRRECARLRVGMYMPSHPLYLTCQHCHHLKTCLTLESESWVLMIHVIPLAEGLWWPWRNLRSHSRWSLSLLILPDSSLTVPLLSSHLATMDAHFLFSAFI